MLKNLRFGFIGGGQMGSAILRGVLQGDELRADQFTVCDIDEKSLKRLADSYGVNTQLNNKAGAGARETAAQCDVLLLAVKPQAAEIILAGLDERLGENTVVWSIMGGVPLARVEPLFPGRPVVRIMPNTPMMLRKGVAGITRGSLAADEHMAQVRAFFELVGRVYELPEHLIDPLTSISGCGPAFAYLFIEALADGGVREGLPRATAQELAAQTLAGAAGMVLQTGLHPGSLKDSVTSPGGGSIEGVWALEDGGFRGTVMDAVHKAALRMREVGRN